MYRNIFVCFCIRKTNVIYTIFDTKYTTVILINFKALEGYLRKLECERTNRWAIRSHKYFPTLQQSD